MKESNTALKDKDKDMHEILALDRKKSTWDDDRCFNKNIK